MSMLVFFTHAVTSEDDSLLQQEKQYKMGKNERDEVERVNGNFIKSTSNFVSIDSHVLELNENTMSHVFVYISSRMSNS